MKPDGSDAALLHTGGMNLLPSWLPDSRHLVWFKKYPSSNLSALYLMDAETTAARPLFGEPSLTQPYSDSMPSVSPDASRVVFVSDRSGSSRLWVADMDGRNARLAAPGNLTMRLDGPGVRHPIDAPIEQKVPVWAWSADLIHNITFFASR